jgi:hypothetical protein
LNYRAFLKALDEATRWIGALESLLHGQNVFLRIQSIILVMIIQ